MFEFNESFWVYNVLALKSYLERTGEKAKTKRQKKKCSKKVFSELWDLGIHHVRSL